MRSTRSRTAAGSTFTRSCSIESGIGPLVADTFSLVMLLGCEGRQFTYLELSRLLADAGFTEMSVTATYGYYSLVSGTRRARAR